MRRQHSERSALPRTDYLLPEVLNGPALVLLVTPEAVATLESMEELLDKAAHLGPVECLNPLAPLPPESPPDVSPAAAARRISTPEVPRGPPDEVLSNNSSGTNMRRESVATQGPIVGDPAIPDLGPPRISASPLADSQDACSPVRSDGGALSVASATYNTSQRGGCANVERLVWLPVQWAQGGSVHFTEANARDLVLLCPRLVFCGIGATVVVDPDAERYLWRHGVVVGRNLVADGVHHAAAVLPSEGASIGSATPQPSLVWWRHGDLIVVPQLDEASVTRPETTRAFAAAVSLA